MQSFLAGLVFDASAVVYWYSPFLLFSLFPEIVKEKVKFQNFLHFLFVLSSMAVLLANIIDIGMFPIVLKRSGIELFTYAKDPSNPLASYLFGYWYLVIIWLVLSFIAFLLYPKGNYIKTNFAIYSFRTLIYLVLFVLFARGGWGLKPIRSFDAARFAKPELTSLVINTPFNINSTIGSPLEKRIQFYNSIELEKILPFYKKYDPMFKNKNIVVIILESFGKEYCGLSNSQQSYTPFLDSLAYKSLVFNNAYANAGRSIEAIPAILGGIPVLSDIPFINSNYSTNTTKNVAYYLSEIGYDCSFYHGGDVGTMGFKNYLAFSGLTNYKGLQDYPDKERDYDGNWGIYDGPYLQYFNKELSKKTEPFFSTLFTLSSHHPYSIPEYYKNKFKKGTLEIHPSIQYADFALGRFFASAKKESWFMNTVFILVADHTSFAFNQYYNSFGGRYEIPILLFSPQQEKILMGINNKTCQQIDLYPTILHLAGYSNKFGCLGRSVFDSIATPAIQYTNSVYQAIEYPYFLQFLADGNKKYYIREKHTDNEIPINGKDSLFYKNELYLKAFIQQHNNRMLDNRFY